MDLIQSTVYSFARVKLSVYQQRIMIKVVASAQNYFRGLHLNDYDLPLEHHFDNVRLAIPIKYILTDGSHNYAVVKTAAKDLCRIPWEYYDSQRRVWQGGSFISDWRCADGSGVLEIWISRYFYNALYDFTKGFKKFDEDKSLTLKSTYSVRLYQILNNQTHPIAFKVDYLKTLFGIASKYKQTRDFILRVIEPSRKELDSAGLNSFRWTPITEGRKITALQFIPVKVKSHDENITEGLTRQDLVTYKAVELLLIEECSFTAKERSCHTTTLKDFAKIPDATTRLMLIIHRARKKDQLKPYVIAAIKAEVQGWKAHPHPKDLKTK